MKNKLSLLALIVIVGLIISIPIVKAAQSYFTVNSSAVATSTVQYLSGTSTYTYALNGGFSNLMSGVDQSNLFVLITASSSATILNWTYQYSNNGTDWYTYNTPVPNTVASTPTLYSSSTALVNTFGANSTTASTTGIVVTVPPVASYYKQVVFSLGSTTRNASIFVQDTEKYNAGGGGQ